MSQHPPLGRAPTSLGLVVANDSFMDGSAMNRYCGIGMRRILGLVALIVVGSLLAPTPAYATESHCRGAEAPQAVAVPDQQRHAAWLASPAPGQGEAPCRNCSMPACPSALCPVITMSKAASVLEQLAIAHIIPETGQQQSRPSRSPQPPTPPPNHSQFLA